MSLLMFSLFFFSNNYIFFSILSFNLWKNSNIFKYTKWKLNLKFWEKHRFARSRNFSIPIFNIKKDTNNSTWNLQIYPYIKIIDRLNFFLFMKKESQSVTKCFDKIQLS